MKPRAFAFAVLLLGLLLACATNPATGRRQLMLVGQADEVRMGREADPEVRAEFGVFEDPQLAGLVSRVGKDIASRTEQPDLPYSFTVLDSPIVNAFALPGGPVYITRGLLAHADDESEMAGVLGHEVGHVVARHGAEQMSRQQLFGAGLGLVSILRPDVGHYTDLLGAGAQLLLLKYSRSAESEADRLGVRYLGRTGYDPLGMPRFLAVLDRISERSGQALPNWMSTHPDPGGRVEATRALAAPLAKRRAKQGKPLRVARDEYLAAVDGLVFGDDPRQGFQRGNTFHHPDMRFRFDVPEGWKIINTRQMVAAVDNAEQPSAQLVLQVVPPKEAQGLGPEEFARRIAREQPKLSFQGEATTLGGIPAWVGLVRVPDQKGGASTMLAGWISHRDQLFQMLGAWASSADRAPAQLERSIRSFRKEDNAEILAVKPVVLDLAQLPAGTSLQQFCAGRRDLGAKCEDVALINSLPLNKPAESAVKIKVPVRQSPVYP
ncbi:MAG: M48 family metalloprotease [Acidobacteria bacterium]|nr:M48 family metalloprotease [Acidobacteriota bacterium]